MRRILALLTLILIFLTGCSREEDYINTVKRMTFENGISVEEIVNKKAIVGEFYFENNLDEILNNPYIFMFFLSSEDEMKARLKEADIKMPTFSELKWEIEGETEDGKIILASNDKIKIKIPTYKNGDYIQLYDTEIQTFIRANNRMIPLEILNNSTKFYDIAVKIGYTGTEDEVKRFDERKVLKNENGYYTLKYYPNGRVSYISDSYIEVSLEDKSNLKEIENNIDELDKSIGKPEYKGEYINPLVDFSYEIEYKIIAEKLNKGITDSEKREISRLEKKAEKVFVKLQNEVDS